MRTVTTNSNPYYLPMAIYRSLLFDKTRPLSQETTARDDYCHLSEINDYFRGQTRIGCLKFLTVRHPYERLVSYNFLLNVI